MDRTFTPDDRASVLLIGSGGIGKRHIRGYLRTGRANLDIVEPDTDRRDECLNTYDIRRGFAHIDEAPLGDYDAAVICSPAHTHVPLGLACARAGTPFFVEKPLSVSMDGVEELCAEVAHRGLPVRVGYVRRSSAGVKELHRRAVSGDIGELKLAYVNLSQDYRKYRPDYRDIYYAKEAMGGGAILDGASHAIDLLLWIFGPIAEVCSMHDRMVFDGVECEDTALMLFRFASGGFAQLALNQFQKPNVQVFEIIGTEGNLKLDMAELTRADDDSQTWHPVSIPDGGEVPTDPMEIHEARFALQANLFLDTVSGADTVLATLDEAKQNLKVALAAKESWRTRRFVTP